MFRRELILKALQEGLTHSKWDVHESAQEKLVDFLELLYKWNSVHNLTSIRSPLDMVQKHILDSLVLLPYLSHTKYLDVGTGPGFPGIPLALSRSEFTFHLLDSHRKKLNFVEHAIHTLQLKNAIALNERVEAYHPETLYPCVISRAFASLKDFVVLSGHLCQPDGRLIAMKGKLDETELAALPDSYTIERVERVFVPNLEAERHIVFIRCVNNV